MNNYNIYAKYYDNFKSCDNYDVFLKYYLDIAEKFSFKGKEILDLGCGTGNSMLPLLKKGFNVEGIDYSVEMLNIAKEKLGNYMPKLYNYDISNFNIEKSFDLIISVDDVINHLTTIEKLDNCFRTVSETLVNSGLFIFDVNTLNTFESFFNEKTIIEANNDTFIFDSVFTDKNAVANITTFSKLKDSDLYDKIKYSVNERYFSYEEISELLEKNGLKLLEVFGLSNRKLNSEPSEKKDIKFIYVAKKYNYNKF